MSIYSSMGVIINRIINIVSMGAMLSLIKEKLCFSTSCKYTSVHRSTTFNVKNNLMSYTIKHIYCYAKHMHWYWTSIWPNPFPILCTLKKSFSRRTVHWKPLTSVNLSKKFQNGAQNNSLSLVCHFLMHQRQIFDKLIPQICHFWNSFGTHCYQINYISTNFLVLNK